MTLMFNWFISTTKIGFYMLLITCAGLLLFFINEGVVVCNPSGVKNLIVVICIYNIFQTIWNMVKLCNKWMRE